MTARPPAPAVTPLPPCERLFGPVTAARLARLGLAYLVLLALGAALLALAGSDALRILGMGLILPGAGFLAHADICSSGGIGHAASALLVLGLFLAALVLWFGTGNILAPPTVWLAAAVAAAAMDHGAIRPGAVDLLFAMLAAASMLLSISIGSRFHMARRRRRRDNAYLAAAAGDIVSIFSAPAANEAAEMSLEHLQRLRFALDRALQPLDRFDGFEQRDQFQTAATRYQLNFLAYAISLTQARYLPACAGYLHDAQIALIDKQRDHRVWRYWRLENLWGNLRSDADPAARENIMYGGFAGLQMVLFHAASGRGDFRQPGRFTLAHPDGQAYIHDATTLVNSVDRGFGKSGFYLMACEPNWIYPLCNAIGANAVLATDAQTGTAHWAGHAAAFRHHLETEFLDASGRYIPCRSARTGLPFPSLGGAMPLAMPCFFLNPIAPDLAQRQWLLLRRQLFDPNGAFRRRAFWPIDTGNYGFSRASAYAATALAAAELGDAHVFDACMTALEEECPSQLHDGVIHRRQASVWAHGVELMARAGARNAFKDIVTKPRAPGMVLDGLAYPEVLVASAHASAGRLLAVLYPGGAESRQTIGLAGLQPGAVYRVSGALVTEVRADAEGRACLEVMLAGRTAIKVEVIG